MTDPVADLHAALVAADAAPDPEGRAVARISLARALVTRDSQRTLALADEVAALLSSGVRSRALSLACATLAVKALYQIGRLGEAIERGQPALALIDDRRPDDDMFGLLSRLTWTYADLGQFEQALTMNRRAMALARRASRLDWEALAYSDLGVIYGRWGKIAESQAAMLRAAEPERFAALAGDDRALICYNVAETYMELGQIDRALAYAEEGLATRRTGFLLSLRAGLHARAGEAGQAEALFREGAALSRAAHDFYDEQANLVGLAGLLHEEGRHAEAIAVAEEALALVEDAPTLRQDALALLSRLAAESGDYRAAYGYERRLSETRAAVLDERATQQARALEVEFRAEIARREAEQARAEREALHERTALLERLVGEREEALATQQRLLATISALSSPVLPLAAGVLAIPLIGVIDGSRVALVSARALESVERHRARALLLDLTGVSLLAADAADALLGVARAVRLLGCRVVLVGVRPEIAEALIAIGADLDEITTRASLAEGLAAALAMVGRRIVAA